MSRYLRVDPAFWLTAAAGLTLACVTAAAIWSDQRATQTALQRLPEGERKTLFEHTRETLAQVCPAVSVGDMQTYCRSQAQFISNFPECDRSCQSLSHRFSPRPTK